VLRFGGLWGGPKKSEKKGGERGFSFLSFSPPPLFPQLVFVYGFEGEEEYSSGFVPQRGGGGAPKGGGPPVGRVFFPPKF